MQIQFQSKDQTVSMNGYAFSLVPTRSGCYYGSIIVDYSPPPNPTKPSNSIVPGFLKDRKFYTPAFVLSREKQHFIDNSHFEKEKFEDKVLKENRLHQHLSRDEADSSGPVLPVPTSQYCQICKQKYTVYSTHILQICHLRQSRFSKANQYINQLCWKIKRQNKSKMVKNKNKPIKKETSLKIETKPRLSRANKSRSKKACPSKQGINPSTQAPSGPISLQ